MRRFARTQVAYQAPEPGASDALPPLVELVDLLEERQPDLSAHGDRVGAYAAATAYELGMPSPAVARVRLAARLHDIGKVWLSPEVLAKPGPLTDLEWLEVRRHPAVGARLLRSAGLYELADIVIAHHERPDGTGYPYGIPAGETLLEARIVAVADVYDAMLSSRPYRSSMSEDDARTELDRVASSQLDEYVVAAFLRVADTMRLPVAVT
jgi:HD-GYP domain-containing protein (c-di-GMP phosphodiesterase class II)